MLTNTIKLIGAKLSEVCYLRLDRYPLLLGTLMLTSTSKLTNTIVTKLTRVCGVWCGVWGVRCVVCGVWCGVCCVCCVVLCCVVLCCVVCGVLCCVCCVCCMVCGVGVEVWGSGVQVFVQVALHLRVWGSRLGVSDALGVDGLRALYATRPPTLGYIGGCDQEQGEIECPSRQQGPSREWGSSLGVGDALGVDGFLVPATTPRQIAFLTPPDLYRSPPDSGDPWNISRDAICSHSEGGFSYVR